MTLVEGPTPFRGTPVMPESPQQDDEIFIVIIGDPAAGFEFFGPFTDYEVAENFADERTDTWTVHLKPPPEPT
jgi:hypothetical protein